MIDKLVMYGLRAHVAFLAVQNKEMRGQREDFAVKLRDAEEKDKLDPGGMHLTQYYKDQHQFYSGIAEAYRISLDSARELLLAIEEAQR